MPTVPRPPPRCCGGGAVEALVLLALTVAALASDLEDGGCGEGGEVCSRLEGPGDVSSWLQSRHSMQSKLLDGEANEERVRGEVIEMEMQDIKAEFAEMRSTVNTIVGQMKAIEQTVAEQATAAGRARASQLEAGTVKSIAGVPIYNYHLVHPSGASPSLLELAEPRDFILTLEPKVSDKKVEDFCAHAPKGAHCAAAGHPSRGGLGFVEFLGTEADLELEIRNNPGMLQFAEPNLDVGIEPDIEDKDKDKEGLLQLDQSEAAAHWKSAYAAEAAGCMSNSWGLDRIDARSGCNNGFSVAADGGKGVHIYVADTGIRTSHEDFGGRAIPTLEIGDSGKRVCQADDKTCALDNHGHGTQCASIAAGKRYGVAKGATIHAVKMLDDKGRGKLSNVLETLDWMATNAKKPAILSMSLGGGGVPRCMDAALEVVANAGVTVVAAAGNQATDACFYYPGYSTSVITVGATENWDDHFASRYSNYGPCVDILAPGSDISGSGMSADDAMRTSSGTSQACPHVSGAAALVLEREPDLAPAQVASQLLEMATSELVKEIPKETSNKLLYVGNFSTGSGPHMERAGSTRSPLARRGIVAIVAALACASALAVAW